jgi:hypothetical protein
MKRIITILAAVLVLQACKDGGVGLVRDDKGGVVNDGNKNKVTYPDNKKTDSMLSGHPAQVDSTKMKDREDTWKRDSQMKK